MDTFANIAASTGIWIGYVVWLLLLLVSTFTILIGLPGGWIALGLCVLYDLFYGFQAVGWQWLAVFLGLLLIAEAIEAGLGIVYVAKKGATRYGMTGAFLGGIVGAIAGSGVVPIIGTLVGGFLGAFGGAVLGEYIREERLEPSLRIGLHAVIGRMLASIVKYALALGGCVAAAAAAFPG